MTGFDPIAILQEVDLKLNSMKAPKAKDGDEPNSYPGGDGVRVHLEHHHIKALGLDGPLPHGSKVSLQGDGEVSESGTHEDMDGEPRHHMTVVLHKAGVDADGDYDGDREPTGKGLRDELKKNTDASEQRVADKGKVKIAALRKMAAKESK